MKWLNFIPRDRKTKPEQLKVRCGDWNFASNTNLVDEPQPYVEIRVKNISTHPGDNFINSLRSTFSSKTVLRSFSLVPVWLCNFFGAKILAQKQFFVSYKQGLLAKLWLEKKCLDTRVVCKKNYSTTRVIKSWVIWKHYTDRFGLWTQFTDISLQVSLLWVRKSRQLYSCIPISLYRSPLHSGS